MVIPEIRFKYGYLLHRQYTPDVTLPPHEEIQVGLERVRTEWKAHEEVLLRSMQETTGLKFYQSLIDVYLIAGSKRSMSDPLITDLYHGGDKLIDTLLEEMLHRLLTDNTLKVDGSVWVKKQYPNIEDRHTINHILVHSVLSSIYLDVLNSPERLKTVIDQCEKYPSYKASWELVEKEGYRNIIQQFTEYVALVK